MKKISVNASKQYDILIGRNLLADSGGYISQVAAPCKVCLMGDHSVQELYGSAVSDSLSREGFSVFPFAFSPGESSKTLATVGDILEFMAKNQFTRSDIIVALGGGITGDIAGFAAGVFLRGINFVQIPTTFLAAVDSSVGGKTGVNLERGKNLAGVFWQPSMVLCDCDTFKTLPYEIFLDGVAEAVKYGAIRDKSLFDLMNDYGRGLFSLTSHVDSADSTDVLLEVVAICVSIKRDIVMKDERDTGERQLLNFGHTLGHAIEKCSHYSISHGHGVAMGMLIICRAAMKLGFSSLDCGKDMESILNKFDFPLDVKFSSKELTSAALNDKKRLGDFITLVLPESIGSCHLEKIPVSELEAFVDAGLSR